MSATFSKEEIIKSSVIYYSNGDIVILSLPDKKNVVTAHKVDKIFLARSSLVFEGMLTIPSSDEEEIYDGVPMVRFHDEAKYLGSFLKALYDFRTIPLIKHHFNTVQTVEGILLLATKYQVDHLRKPIITILEGDWPTDLDTWHLAEGELKALHEAYDNLLDESAPEPCSAIALARCCDVPTILVAAFYHLSRVYDHSFRKRVRAARDENGDGDSDTEFAESVARDEHFENKEDYLYKGGRMADLELLTPEDTARMLKGRKAMVDYFVEHSVKAATAADEHECAHQNPEACSENFMQILGDIYSDVMDDYDPLKVLATIRDYLPPLIGRPCGEAWVTYENYFRDHQVESTLWDKLPEFFGMSQVEASFTTDV